MSNQFTEEEKNFFFSKMLDLSSIYEKAKYLMLLSEYYNSKQGIVVATINELRGSLDHIMRSLFLSNKEKYEDELFKAEGHLYRAIYDSCEVIIIDRLQYIKDFKNTVSSSSLKEAYPDYYKKILPYITQVKEILVDTRRTQIVEERINKYTNIVEELIKICDDLDKKAIEITRTGKKISYIFPVILGAWAIIFVLLNTFWDNFLFVKILASFLISIIAFLVLFFIKNKKKE